MNTNPQVALVLDYLAALGSGATGDALAAFFTADARQIEYPNKLNPKGGESDLPTLLARSEQGKKVLREQRYVVRTAIAHGENVAVEADWVGVLAIPVGSLQPGDEMKAAFAMFFEFAEGRIHRQRNYDCFDAF